MTLPADLTLAIRILPGDVPADVRLRRALKCLLRSFGLRAIQIATQSDEVARLRAENEQLRQELARLRQDSEQWDCRTCFTAMGELSVRERVAIRSPKALSRQ